MNKRKKISIYKKLVYIKTIYMRQNIDTALYFAMMAIGICVIIYLGSKVETIYDGMEVEFIFG